MSDSKDLATREDKVPTTAASVIGGVLSMAKDPSIDAAKVETLTRLAIDLQDRERRAEFNRSKIAAIRDMPAIYKRGKSDKHRYAKFEDLHRAVMPILARNGMTIDFKVGSSPKGISVVPILRHENGHVEEGLPMEGPPDTGPGRSAIQAIGSSTSYLKRHSLKATLNIIEDDEDNDGVGFREGEQKNDRQERLIIDAEEKAASSREAYDDFYRSLPPKDKAWLIRAGVHTRLAGAPAIPGPAEPEREEQARREEPVDAEFEPVVDEQPATIDERQEPEAPAEAEPDPKTAEGWTTIFERNCAAAASLARVDELEKAGANAIRKLSTDSPKLWERVDGALLSARDRLKDAAPAGDDTFPGDR